ncbi:hypothetical protein [Xenorhabdus griffiniae]|uniref:hypothetical protein n=1 Tax=Xenorhabdus griffiniae TaxID=351672 RepID=UPI0023589CC2|nr:hypothetical protein [Xenorhabdus griffiniae]MDC9607057.1 hypothetical protein [Xenorhabdus griffiniae]
MGNVFDFQMNADENVTRAISEMEAKLKQLNPLLNSTRDGLRLGGSETLENTSSLSNKLRDMSRHAQDNVQNIGDMIPPLKMFGELSGKYLDKGLKLGGIGAIGYGITKMGQKLNEQSKDAYNLNVMAKNNNMTPEEFSRLSGAMVILGADADKARESVDGLYKIFNDPLWSRNDAALAQLNEMGVSIIRKDDGTADVTRTMEELAKVFPTYSSAKQKTIADFLGLDANTLALLREGAKYKQLLAKSDALGLTVPNELNQKLTELNGTISSLNASWEGFKQRVSNSVTDFALSDDSINDGLDGISQVFEHNDRFAYMKALGVTRGKEADQLREVKDKPEFYDSLTWDEKTAVNLGMMTDGVRGKYQQWQLKYGDKKIESPQVPEQKTVEQQKHYKDIYKMADYSNGVNVLGKQPRGIRNNNPLNIEFAKQKGATVEDHPDKRFAKFNSPYTGLERTAWQLRRYFNGLTDGIKRQSVEAIVGKWAPPGSTDKNRTEAYIQRVSNMMGVNRSERLDLNNHDVMYALMKSMGIVESKSFPYDKDLVMSAITGAPVLAQASEPVKAPVLAQAPIITPPQLPVQSEEPNINANAANHEEKKTPSLYDKQKQQFISLYDPQREVDAGAEMTKYFAKAFQEAIGENPLKLEITLVNDKTGERQKFLSNSAGKVTTSMIYS